MAVNTCDCLADFCLVKDSVINGLFFLLTLKKSSPYELFMIFISVDLMLANKLHILSIFTPVIKDR